MRENTKKWASLILFLLPFLIYWNAIDNEYAIDDNLVVDGVEKIEEGVSAIGAVFTSHYSTDNTQSYGYRPMSSLSFALEKEFFSGLPEKQSLEEKGIDNKITQANISHFVNVLLYALTGLLLFYFLSLIFPGENFLLPFLTALLFLLLPIHSEPVNNIKSRDALLVLLWILGSLVFYVKYSRDGKWWRLPLAMLCMLLAIFSKKSGVAIIGIAPVVSYFIKTPPKKILVVFLSAVCTLVAAILVKKSLLGASTVRNIEYFENPLLTMGGFFDRLAMGFYSAFFYLKMMVFPKEFSFYYGYDKIPMVDWGDLQVWLGVIVFVPLAVFGIKRYLKRDAMGLGIVLWFGVMAAFVNVAFPIVGIVAERFAYIFSLGFCLFAAALLIRLFKLETGRDAQNIYLPKVFVGAMAIIVAAYSIKTMSRNADWENYLVLYRADIGHLEKSAKANELLGTLLLGKVISPEKALGEAEKTKILNEAKHYYEDALAVAPDYIAVQNNLGFIYLYLGQFEKSLTLLKAVEKNNPDGTNKKEVTSNLAFAYRGVGDYEKAIPYFIQTIENFPNRENAYPALFEIAQIPGYKSKIEDELDRISPQLEVSSSIFNVMLGNYYGRQGNQKKAIYYFTKASLLNPDNEKLKSFIKENLSEP